VLLVLWVHVSHQDPEGIALQLTQLQLGVTELKVAKLDATQPAGRSIKWSTNRLV